VSHWTFTEFDRRTASELQQQLPPVLFDAHAHLWCTRTLNLPDGHLFGQGPEEVSPAVWRERLGRQVGGERLAGALFIPVPHAPPEHIDEINRWMLRATVELPVAKALALLTPGMSPAHIEPLLQHKQFAGFKPYHTYSTTKPTFDAFPGDYIPDCAWQLAEDRQLAITLHLVRAGAMADRGNLRYLQERCERFGRARVILAHAGRAFHAPNARKGAEALSRLQNLWFDTSAICEAEPLRALLDACGPRRLLWGSDFPVSEQRGRCATAGDGFIWMTPDTVHLEKVSPSCRLLPVGLESLRALLTAAWDAGLDHDDLQDIFADNARRLLGFLTAPATRTQDLYRHAKRRIPGGTQLLSKRPEMQAPDQWPAYFREARGCETWDLDGTHYFDLSTSGIGSCLLGFRDPDVSRAVQRRIGLGSMCSLNSPEEVELADLLCEIHPWAEQVRFARCGGEACAIAVRIARATTDRSLIAVCGYSGWQDWYLAANLGDNDALRGHLLPGLEPVGVPRELRGTAMTFEYNDRAAFETLLAEHGDRLAAVVMEPCRSNDPAPGFLQAVCDGAHRVGALLVFDEITIGWRLHFGGAHLKFGVAPDLAIFAKALGNGHPMAAVIGTAAAMAGAHDSFISSTYWTESVGPVAALATLRKMQQVDVPAHVARIGGRVQEFWRESGRQHGLPVQVGGYPCLAHFRFEHEQAEGLRTLYTQRMLDRGFLAGASLYPSLAHTDEVVSLYGQAIDQVFAEIASIVNSGGDVARHLRGPVAHTGFRRLTS
jgi:glutamate-1-semialdehyde 2,1-aminomutase